MQRLVLAAMLLAGCGGPSYYLVTSTLAENSRGGDSAVAASASYAGVIGGIRRVAVRAPDRCAEQTAASATGAASTAGVILQTRCGVEMAELERALARAGFTVFSWRVISDMATREKITPLAAARRVGAEVMFQVNSLEKSTAEASKDVRWERHFYHSDQAGARGAQAMLEEQKAQQLEQLVAPDELSLVANTRLSVTIDVSAILIETGESFWFYSRTNVEGGSSSKSTSALASCSVNGCARVERSRDKVEAEGERTGGVQQISLTGRPANVENAIYYRLLGQTIDDLVLQFGGNVPRGTRAAAPAPRAAPAPSAPTAAPPAPAPAAQPAPAPAVQP